MLRGEMLNISCLRHINIFLLTWTCTNFTSIDTLFYALTHLANERKYFQYTEKLTVDSVAL